MRSQWTTFISCRGLKRVIVTAESSSQHNLHPLLRLPCPHLLSDNLPPTPPLKWFPRLPTLRLRRLGPLQNLAPRARTRTAPKTVITIVCYLPHARKEMGLDDFIEFNGQKRNVRGGRSQGMTVRGVGGFAGGSVGGLRNTCFEGGWEGGDLGF